MYEKEYLMLPGPTPVPPRVLRALSVPMINHRGPAFQEILEEVTQGIKEVYQTKNDVLVLTSSGSGGMEAAVVNLISPGDKVLAISVGAFGDRFAKIAATFGAQVEKIDFEWGKAFDSELIKDRLAADKNHEFKAILCTHNETSTGVVNDLAALRKAIGDHPALLLVDAVSGLGVMDLKTDEWGLDVVVTAGQKAFMIPPGLSFISVSPRAWKINSQCTMPRFYWDLAAAKKFGEKGQTPYTPALPLITALKEALNIFKEQGLAKIIAQYALLRDMTRAGIRALGLELLAEDSWASAAVTAVKIPEGLEAKTINKKMREEYNVVLAGGQGQLENKIIRVGHLGYVQPIDIIATLSALEMTLKDLGNPVVLGNGVRSAQEIYMERR